MGFFHTCLLSWRDAINIADLLQARKYIAPKRSSPCLSTTRPCVHTVLRLQTCPGATPCKVATSRHRAECASLSSGMSLCGTVSGKVLRNSSPLIRQVSRRPHGSVVTENVWCNSRASSRRKINNTESPLPNDYSQCARFALDLRWWSTAGTVPQVDELTTFSVQ